MKNYRTIELGKISSLINLDNGKAFLHDPLVLTSCEISVNCVPAKYEVPFNHKHKQNEEIYIFLKGEGIVEVDGKELKVKEGTVIAIAPSATRKLSNTGKDEMQFICIQAKADSLEQFGMQDGELC